MRPDVVDRFWPKVDKSGPIPAVDPSLGRCWLWTATKFRDGYGAFTVAYRQRGAHRVAYEIAKGSIAGGMQVDHLCFTPLCVNPSHLRLLTPHENAKNQLRARKTHCEHGHEFTPENTRLQHRPNGAVWRACRECQRAYFRRRRMELSSSPT